MSALRLMFPPRFAFGVVSPTIQSFRSVSNWRGFSDTNANLSIGNDRSYQSKLQWENLQWTADQLLLVIGHFTDTDDSGICVNSCRFLPSDDDQTKLWDKTASGWKSVQTSAVALASAPSNQTIADYVTRCASRCVQEVQHYKLFMAIARSQTPGSKLLNDALGLWTANRLLMKGWKIGGSPAPRVLQNQLDHRLELFVSELEARLLRKLEAAMTQKKVPRREVFSATIVLLAAAERDIWRLMYWIRHQEEVGLEFHVSLSS